MMVESGGKVGANAMPSPQIIVVAGLIAVTIPLVVSLFAAFDPRSRVRTVSDYFLYSKNLDLDGFLKASIGYSLQAASIALFFLWSISYGVRAVLVAIAWCLGYFLIAACIHNGRLNSFLETSQKDDLTIHGYLGRSVLTEKPGQLRLLVMLIASATIIGLGGTMIAEIDYSTKITLNTLGIPTASGATSLVETSIHVVVLIFTLFYVIWGGYRAVVLTERYQVPAAYISFAVFGIGVLFLLARVEQFRLFGLTILALLAALLSGILYERLRLFSLRPDGATAKVSSTDEIKAARLAAWLTFLPLITLALMAFVVAGLAKGISVPTTVTLPTTVTGIIWPDVTSCLGFGIWGALSLFIANFVWQLIDISSLQRLQSISAKFDEKETRDRIASALRLTGIEAGIGWSLIILVGLALRGLGVDKPEALGTVLFSYAANGQATAGVIIPIFLFAVSVFMLSTISGFMSALSYVSYYDLVGIPNGKRTSDMTIEEQAPALATARKITFLVVLFIYLGTQP
jgi:hypothetical protein